MEIEIKYSVPDAEVLQRIGDAGELAGFAIGELRDKQVQDRYMDTDDLRFYHAGYVCRVRAVDGQTIITLKSLAGTPEKGAVHNREEYETTATGDQPDAWAEGETREMALSIAGGKPLQELFSLKQTRRVGGLFENGRNVAELSLDQVLVGANGQSQPFFEAEAELRPDGAPADIERLAEYLEQTYGLQAQPRSKFERALELLRPDLISGGDDNKKETPGVLPQDSMRAAARKLIGFNFPKMVKKEEGTISGEDPEDLHDMRVATRRMRGAARVFAPYFTDGSTKKLGRQLRDTADTLGGVRDMDVQLEHARAFREQLPEDQQPGFDRLLSSWEKQRESARQVLIAHLESREYRRLKKDLQRFVEAEEEEHQQGPQAEIAPWQVRHRAGSEIWEHFEEVWAFEVVAGEPSDEQLHDLRIACKYLRYSLEFFEEVLPPGARQSIEMLTRAQDNLGSLHDAVVTLDRLHVYLEGARKKKKRNGDDLAGANSYLLERQAALTELRNSFPALWKQLAGRKFRNRLAEQIAGIGA